jgi:uncharacterized protein
VRIRWDEIPAEGLFFRLDDESWLPKDEIVCQRAGQCAVSLKKEGERVLFAGTLRLPVVLECDRCLDSFEYILAEEFELIFELYVKEDEAVVAADHLCKDSELDVVSLAEPVVDVFSVLAQQVYLGLPEKKLCKDTCLGLCAKCGANLNRGSCDCAKGESASPFSVLAKLKIQ